MSKNMTMDQIMTENGDLIWATESQIKQMEEFKRTHPNGLTPEEQQKELQKTEDLVKRIFSKKK